MGNYVSCTLSTPGGKSTKVILPTGEIRVINAATTAAELMVETPNHFVVNTSSLKIGRRFSPLAADEDLELANVYLMLPMKRVHSAVTAADMGLLYLAAKRSFAGGKVGVLPAVAAPESKKADVWPESEPPAETTDVPKLNLDDIEEFSTPEFSHRLSMSRSRKPLLETITE
ncbi:uncharacterized protein LOC110807507 [Carica papaya]|uniref:uncharacterized protein LOC110807507 n=1 Tax=Carica papaya TaxID=3649 RepID=UPI000B8C927C|nr:uncharacterized protein LOC110807507 [Carica papaya]